MKIIKYTEFINEEFNDTPESYIETALNQIKNKIDKMFDYEEVESDDENITIQKAKLNSKSKSKITFKDLGIKLDSSEISKYSKMYDSLTVKFSDSNSLYNLFISIDIKEGIPKNPEEDFSFEDIENCFVKFKKYDLDTFDVSGQITKNVKIKDIDEEFIIELKIELDDKFGDEDEKLEIETE